MSFMSRRDDVLLDMTGVQRRTRQGRSRAIDPLHAKAKHDLDVSLRDEGE